MQRKSKYFKRILTSYIFTATVPVLLLTVLIYNIGFIQLRNEMITGQQTLLEQVSETINVRMKECSRIATSISMDESILSLSSGLQPIEIMNGVSTLHQFVSANSFFDNIIIRNGEADTLYTAEGTVGRDVLMDRRYHFSSEEKDLFLQKSSDGNEHLIYFSQAQMMMQFIPIPVSSHNKNNCVVFAIDSHSLTDLISGCDNSQYGTIMLLDQQQQLLHTINTQNTPGTEELLPLILSADDNVIRYQKEQYAVIAETVEETGWTFVSIVPYRWLRLRMRYAYMVIWLVGVILVTGVIAFWLSKKNYHPIGKFIRIIDGNPAADKQRSLDELESIGSALIKYQDIGNRMLKQRALLRDNLIIRLLHGDEPDSRDMTEALTALNMVSDDDAYCAVVAKTREINSEQAYETILETIEKRYTPGDRAYGVRIDEQVIGIILRLNKSPEESALDFAAELHESLLERGLCLVCGIGRQCRLSRISISYMEAFIALNQMDSHADSYVMHIDSLESLPLNDDDYHKKLSSYTYCLQQSDFPGASDQLDALLTLLHSRYTVKPIQQYYRFRLLEAVVRLLADEQYMDIPAGKDRKELTDLFTVTLPSCSLHEFCQHMSDITARLCTLTARNTALMEEEQHRQIMDWIQANINNPMLSLNMLSDVMGYSAPYWSHYFKENLLVSFNEFVWCQRKQMVKERMKLSNDAIGDIVLEAGYQDISSFIRRFKKDEGVTPGQFRRMNQAFR